MSDKLNVAPRVALVCGQWGQNIGNAFFNIGGAYVLKRVFGDDAVGCMPAKPRLPAPRSSRRKKVSI